MAIWQFPFFIIPDVWAEQQDGNFTKHLSEDGWELKNVWMSSAKPISFLKEFDQIIPRAKSWHDELAVWKSREHDSDIYAWHSEGNLTDLQVRLDMRAGVKGMIDDITEFCKPRKLSFLIMGEGKRCPPDTEKLTDHALASRAASRYNITHIKTY